MMFLKKGAIFGAVLLVSAGLNAMQDRPNSYDLCMAAGRGDVAEVEACLARGDDINGDDGLGGMTPLSCAAFDATPDMVRLLLACGAEVDLPDADGVIPLYRLLQKSWSEEVVDVASLLIGAGATWVDANGQTFWQEADRLNQERMRRVNQAPRAPRPRRRLDQAQMDAIAARGVRRRLFE